MNITVLGTPLALDHDTGRISSVKYLRANSANADTSAAFGPKGDTVTECWMYSGDKDSCITLYGNIPLQAGHEISLIKARSPKSGMYVAVANHSTRKVTLTGSAESILQWLGLSTSSAASFVVYLLCGLLCLPLWLYNEKDMLPVIGLILVCAVGVQFYLLSRVKYRLQQGVSVLAKGIRSYAEELRRTVEVLGSASSGPAPALDQPEAKEADPGAVVTSSPADAAPPAAPEGKLEPA